MPEPVIADKSPSGVAVEAGMDYRRPASGKSGGRPFRGGPRKQI